MTTTNRSTLSVKNPASPSTSELRALFNGRAIAPNDPRYESARTIVYGGIDRRPAASIRAAYPGAAWNRLRQVKAKYDLTKF